MSVLIETTLGDLVFDLYGDKRPKTCMNFLKLCKLKYYNFSLFFHLQNGFIAQAGDPTNTGRGGDSVYRLLYGDQARYFETERIPPLKHIKAGTLSMVNNGSDGHGSQFFITLGENLDFLDDKHTVFGELAEGFDTLEKLNEVISDDDHRPYRDVRITHTIILDDPYPDPPNLHFPERSPSPTFEILKDSRIGIDEEIDDTQGKSVQELHEEMESKEAKTRAHILEMIGDLHHADERPPDNVLFVCKLNPVTTEDDLVIIFGRFGKIIGCEVIRDRKTNNSLQYAFIEFERVEDCESAYFKMDNVLIDDRRIHVDFSQSVAKNFTWRKQVDKGKQTSASNKDASSSSPPRRQERSPPVRSRRSRSPTAGRGHERRRESDGRRSPRRRDRSRSPRDSRRRTDRRHR